MSIIKKLLTCESIDYIVLIRLVKFYHAKIQYNLAY
jgi:hypothetical protein